MEAIIDHKSDYILSHYLAYYILKWTFWLTLPLWIVTKAAKFLI
jgi:hypothetical protein